MKTISKYAKYTFYSLFAASLLVACADDDDSSVNVPITPNEEEVITTLNVTLNDGTNSNTFSFSDPDGDGGNAPTIDTIAIASGTTYTVSLQFLDESDPNDVEDITAEILMEDDEHLICFETSTGLTGVTITRTDTDGTYEVGLQSSWVAAAGAASNNGTVKVTLRHQPMVKDGTCTPGDTDIEVDFPVKVS